MQQLRGPQGCPWDRKQTLRSLRSYLLEETYEALEALDRDDPKAHAEELGDLLFQVVFQAHIRSELGQFSLADVVDGICDKLESRHPHVFGSGEDLDDEEVASRWHAMKKAEGKGDVTDVPQTLPALMRAQKVGRRAARVGFDWDDVVGAWSKLDEELMELRQAVESEEPSSMARELGDVLFSVVNVARHLNVDAEKSLNDTTKRFVERFTFMQQQLSAGDRSVEDSSMEELNDLWDMAKTQGQT